MTEPRFTEEEFAEILRRASEMQARLPARTSDSPGDPEGPATGMALSDIRAIAAEVGIDPELVTRAAALVSHEFGADEGSGHRWVLSSSAPGSLTDEDKLRVVRAMRAAAEFHGDADMAGAGLEWRSDSSKATRVLVTVEPLDGRNEVRVSVDASPVAVLWQLLPALAGAFFGAAFGAGLELGLVGGIALVGGSAGAALGVGRLVWKRLRTKAVARSRKIFSAAMSALPAASSDN